MGYQKKEFDPTIVSAQDLLIARESAIKAVYSLEAARITVGLPAYADEQLKQDVEILFNDIITAASHERVGSANPVDAVADAEAALQGGGLTDGPTFKTGKHAGRKLSDVAADPKAKGYIEWRSEEQTSELQSHS